MGTIKHTYRHDIDTVFAKLTDADFLKRRSEAAGHRKVQIDVDQRDSETEVRVARDIESDIPSFAKKFVDAVNHVVDVQKWRTSGDTKTGTYFVEVTSRIRIRGEMSLKPVDGGCEYSDTFTPEVDIPLVGKKIGKIVEKETAQAIEEDCRWTERELGAG